MFKAYLLIRAKYISQKKWTSRFLITFLQINSNNNRYLKVLYRYLHCYLQQLGQNFRYCKLHKLPLIILLPKYLFSGKIVDKLMALHICFTSQTTKKHLWNVLQYTMTISHHSAPYIQLCFIYSEKSRAIVLEN